MTSQTMPDVLTMISLPNDFTTLFPYLIIIENVNKITIAIYKLVSLLLIMVRVKQVQLQVPKTT